MKRWIGWCLLPLLLASVGCKNRVATNHNSQRDLDVTKVIAKTVEQQLKFKVMTLKGKADFASLTEGNSISFTYRIDIAKDSLILIHVSKLGMPAMNMLVSQDSVKMRMPLNNTASICDFALLKKVAKIDLDYAGLQAILLGDANLEMPVTMTDSKGPTVTLSGSRPPRQLSWILNTSHFRLEKMRIEDINLGHVSELTYSDFKKIDGQMVATSLVMEATQAQKVRIELHHSGIEFDKEKVNFRYRIPESYTITPCDAMPLR
jgi:hypothetical protein